MAGAAKPVRTIGIRGSGPGAGKDTLADFVCAELEAQKVTFRRARFATPLRECVQVLTGVTVAESETEEGKRRHLPDWGMTVGQMLQRLGTEAVRDSLHPDAWVLALFSRLEDDEVVVISDVRFPNEESAIRGRDGIIIHVERSQQADLLAGRDPSHASETARQSAPEPEHVCANDGTLDELRAKAKALVAAII